MSIPAPLWSEVLTVGDVLLRSAWRRPAHSVLVAGAECSTYADLADRARAVARSLAGLGVRPGDRVGLLMPNGPESVAALFGIALSGAVVVPINARFRARELRHVVSNADLVALLTMSTTDAYVDFVELLRDALPGLADADDSRALGLDEAPALRSIVAFGDKPAAGTLDADAFAALGAGVDDAALECRRAGVRVRGTAIMLFTSGTTSAPRGCRISHEAIVRNWTSALRCLGVTEDDRVWNPGPFFHIAGLGVLVASIAAGATVLTDANFEPARALDLLERERATVLYPAFSTLTLTLMGDPRFAEADLSQARVMLNVGLPETLRQIQDAFPRTLQVSTFGMTESCGITAIHTLDDPLEVRLNTVGRPLPGVEVAVIDPVTQERLPAGDAGELLVRGWNLADGYHKDPEKTAQSFDEDGWLHTGDRALIREDGNLVYSGRMRDMLRVGGENVSPAEVEEHLSSHPDVLLAQVVGVPDPRLDEVPVAFVERLPGATVTEEELIAFCQGQIARFKIPRHVRFVSEWPMSATKIKKNALRDRIREELGARPPV